MDASVLDHRLSEQERATFEEQGFLPIPGALSSDHVERLVAITDRIHQQHVTDGGAADSAMFVADFIGQDPAFLDLVDHTPIIAKVWGILGWNISLYHTHLIVTPPSGKPRSTATFGWHQDSGRVNRDLPPPRPRLSIKVGYFLSDVSQEGRGNFWVVPGSHVRDELPVPDGEGQPDGAIPVVVEPGTAVIFDRRLWHAASPNWSDITRKVLFYGYGYRWIRPKDELSLERFYEGSDPVRRQLLGDGLNANGRYSPTDDDVPLKGWLAEHAPEDVRA